MKKILILGASALQLPAIKKAKKLGYCVGVVDYNPSAVGAKYADEFFCISTLDVEQVLATAKAFKINGIMTLATDAPMRTVAAVCQELDLPGITVETAKKATDKGAMIKAFEKKNVAHPWFHILSTKEELVRIKNLLSYPCVVKPTDNAGNRGVVYVENEQQLVKGFEYSKQSSMCGNVIIEEYLVGTEVSVEAIIVNGRIHIIAVTDKLTLGAPYFVEIGHSEPSQIAENELDEIKDLACRAIEAVGINSGAAHVEIMLTDKGPYMVELGARLGGGYITSHLVPLSTGVDVIEAAVMVACGQIPNLSPEFNKGSAIRHIIPTAGTIRSIQGVENALAVKGVRAIEFTKREGDTTRELQTCDDRIGCVIAQADSAVAAIDICETALKKVEICIVAD